MSNNYGSQNGYNNRRGNRVEFSILEHLAVLENYQSGWAKEANIVTWNGGAPKVDIREWDPAHEKMSKGVTLFEKEAEKLAKALARRYRIDGTKGFYDRNHGCADRSPRAVDVDREPGMRAPEGIPSAAAAEGHRGYVAQGVPEHRTETPEHTDPMTEPEFPFEEDAASDEGGEACADNCGEEDADKDEEADADQSADV